MVFYDRDLLNPNKELIEIKNQAFVDKIRKDFNAKFVQYNSLTPLICGTIVTKGYH